jgi:myo-inositol-1-phosphate synthase
MPNEHHSPDADAPTTSAAAPVIQPADGRLAVLCVGLGAVGTTLIAGVESIRTGAGQPIGSLSQLGTVRLGRRDEQRVTRIADLVPLSSLDQLDFCAWDPFPDDAYVAATRAGVLEQAALEHVGAYLRTIRPLPAVFDPTYVTQVSGPNTRPTETHRQRVEAIRGDVMAFMEEKGSARAVMVWCGSTETLLPDHEAYHDLEAFEAAIDRSDRAIAPSMLYAYAALGLGIPFVNCSPNLSIDTPALTQYAAAHSVAIAGKDLKTGQTMVKTVLAPMLKARMLGLTGWYSTNILGNRDGEVLQDPDSFRAKEQSKIGVLEGIMQPELYPELYGDIEHQVSINYYRPRGDNKEGWDNIDFFGWLGYPMQLKVNFLCRDSILAAPLVLDLLLFADLAQRSGMRGIQEWLSFYFKSPQCAPGVQPEHDLFIQLTKLKNTLRFLAGEEPITHLGLEYYDYFS